MECLRSVYKAVCCISDPVFPNQYDFSFGGPDDLLANKRNFESNFVRTSKYHWYDFLPSTSPPTQSPSCCSSSGWPTSTSSSSASCSPYPRSAPWGR